MPFWLDSPLRPESRPSFGGSLSADLAVVGAGFTGLWAAVEAKRSDPNRDVVLIESDRIASGASGRNGGFVSASLTHGFSNGVSRWPDDMQQLEELGIANLKEIGELIQEYGIDCDWHHAGELDVAVQPHQVASLRDEHEEMRKYGLDSNFLIASEVQERVNSPLYLAARFDPNVAVVDPARLSWGLAKLAKKLGVTIFENTRVHDVSDAGDRIQITTNSSKGLGRIDAQKMILATGAFQPLLKRLSHFIVPVYDYVLVTQPLSDSQRSAIGWLGREGISDVGNQFHYYRMTADNRILFGGYDAMYHRNNGMGPQFDIDRESFARLADHFDATFPQLSEVDFSHGWGGAIDTCSRFTAFWGTAHGGKTAYVAGYTGLGVGASRFGAMTCLDLLSGEETVRTALPMVTSRPIPFPPEPLRSLAISLTKRSLQRADQREGRRNLWLKTLDSLGLGFDS